MRFWLEFLSNFLSWFHFIWIFISNFIQDSLKNFILNFIQDFIQNFWNFSCGISWKVHWIFSNDLKNYRNWVYATLWIFLEIHCISLRIIEFLWFLLIFQLYWGKIIAFFLQCLQMDLVSRHQFLMKIPSDVLYVPCKCNFWWKSPWKVS